MEGRYPPAIYWALNELTDMSRADEFNKWYHRIHIPDCTHNVVYSYASRFINPEAGEGEGYSLVIYEIHKDMDLFEAWDAMGKAPRAGQPGREFEARRSLGTGVYRKIGGEYRSRYNRPVHGVYGVVANCVPGREDEFNAWYEDVHMPDILETGMFHTGYRYECIDVSKLRGAEGGRYLAIYETDLDADKAVHGMQYFRDRWQEAGRLSDAIQVVRRFYGQRDWPAE